MSRKLPSLTALRAFEAAARQGSFAKAADELHVTAAAVSQQIKQLEDYLGVNLFRRGKTLALSETAATALPQVTEAFDQLERAVARLRAGQEQGPLVVSAPPVFAARWLVPRLEDFQARHPDVELRLLATRRLVDFALEDVDLAIRFGPGPYPGLHVEHLMPETIVAVAAPALAADIAQAADLPRCTLLEDEWHTGSGVFPDWESWLSALGVTADAPLRIRRFSDVSLAIHAALAGLGVTLAWRSLVADDLAAGRLIHLLDHSVPSSMGFHLVAPANRLGLGKVAAFRDWLLERTGEAPERVAPG